MPSHKGRNLDAPLTPTEKEVLQAIADHGFDYFKVGQALFVSRDTARTHTDCIRRKLDVTNSVDMMVAAMRLGIVQ